jgi:hypothetical protein
MICLDTPAESRNPGASNLIDPLTLARQERWVPQRQSEHFNIRMQQAWRPGSLPQFIGVRNRTDCQVSIALA